RRSAAAPEGRRPSARTDYAAAGGSVDLLFFSEKPPRLLLRPRRTSPLLAHGVQKRDAENQQDEEQRQPGRDRERHVALRVQELDHQLHTHPRDDDERAVDQRWI